MLGAVNVDFWNSLQKKTRYGPTMEMGLSENGVPQKLMCDHHLFLILPKWQVLRWRF